VLTRKVKPPVPGVTWVSWLNKGDQPEKELEGIHAFINLAGESINAGRWSNERKERLLSSRIEATKECLRIIHNLNEKPKVFINASAVEAERVTEDNKPLLGFKGMDFLATVTHRLEQEASKAVMLGIRTVYARFGIVLGSQEGALSRMVLPYRMFVGGKVGSGNQWVSWIHIADVVGLLLFAIEKHEIRGPLRITSPHPVTMDEFGKTIGNVLHRPHWIPVPPFALKLALGEMSLLVLDGSYVLPEKALAMGYTFRYPHLEDALKDILFL
ncbi:MAG TPA: TIGR01777 family protein, partial [Paenibacillaceae bacterium]|nr:TIGR01777 family protein [Paenibacillaceae bacterium]